MADKMKSEALSLTQKEIKKNTKLILESPSNVNLLVDIIEVSDSDEEEILLAFIKSVHKIFTTFLNDKKIVQTKSVQNVENGEKTSKADDQENPEDVFGAWLYDKYLVVVNKLLKVLHHNATNVQELSLCTLMKFLVSEHKGLARQSKTLFPVVLYGKIFEKLVSYDNDMSALINRFSEFMEYDDVRFYSMKNLSKSLENHKTTQSSNSHIFIRNVFSLLNLVKMPLDGKEFNNFLVIESEEGKNNKDKVFQLKSHKRSFSKSWLGFLSNPLTSEIHKKVLLNLHTNVIPYMNDPKMLMDFLTDSYNSGGAISLLALNGLFILIHKHNLDYPDFYKKLYALLEPGIFHVKYQSRFFHLLDLFLTSTHLPAYLVAAFCKRLAQLALSAPPQGVILAIMFVKNLMKRHPSCQVLVHKKEVSKLLMSEDDLPNNDPLSDPSSDPYDPIEPDPAKCKALQSSLWELKTLENHFYPNMPSLIEAFQKPMDKVEVDISKYFDVSYDDLFEKHLVKVSESNAVLEYELPKGILGNELSENWSLE